MLYLLQTDGIVAIFDFHIVVCFVDDFDEDDELLDVGIHHELQRLFHQHPMVDDVDNQILLFDVSQLYGYSLDDVGQDSARFIIYPLHAEQQWVVLFELFHEDNLDYHVDERRDRQIEFYVRKIVHFWTSLKNSFSTLFLYS